MGKYTAIEENKHLNFNFENFYKLSDSQLEKMEQMLSEEKDSSLLKYLECFPCRMLTLIKVGNICPLNSWRANM